MRIGILTLHKACNFGAALQVYALQKTLLDNRFNVSVINYHNIDIYRYHDYHILSDRYHIKTTLGKILRYRYNKKVFLKFESFQKKHLILSPVCKTLPELKEVESHYSAIICGSDQVWNPKAIFNDFDAFLLGTVSCKKIAYAASAGSVSLWEKHLQRYWDLLHRFDAISVREADMLQPVENLSQKKVSLVCDPTLLLDCEDWIKIENKDPIKNLDDGYILVYFLGSNEVVVKAALELQKKTNLPIVSIGRRIKGSYRPAVGPDGFLTLFHHASYVLTSSFHGTVFAIQYQKPFLVFGNGIYNSRMLTLLNHLGIQERMVANCCSTEQILSVLNKPLDWAKINFLRNILKEHSLNFLKTALE